MKNMSSTDSLNDESSLFGHEENALATCEAALHWLRRYRDAHGGVFPERIFNALIRLRPSISPEVIVHKIIDGEIYFWLTARAVDEADPFNGMWHYTGTVDRYGDYLVGGIRRVLDRELGGATLRTCRRVGTIYPISSRRADILSILFLCTIDGEPSSTEQGRWFSAPEALRLVPFRKGQDGIIPSHLVGLALCIRTLGQSYYSTLIEPSSLGVRVNGDDGFFQDVVLVDDIDAHLVARFGRAAGAEA
jgi:hypothetical protein